MNVEMPRIPAGEGMLAHLVARRRPALAERIAATGRIETAVIGLGDQGTRHAGLMRAFGTAVAAGVSPGDGPSRVHETIPVYPTVAAMLDVHPDIAAVSIWRHFSSAADAAVEAVEAGIPIVVLITEGMPVKDVRRVLVAARRRGTLLLGPNTPGLIFPPERVKIGMLPDVFYPAEPEPGRVTAAGVSICSRSGAILYHMSDALASAGIAQNAVIGVGGDSAVGAPFPAIVPMVMDFPGTDLVVVAGEIGGCQEELLAADIAAHPERYPKPIVALVSGRCAPQGKTMGHAGAIVNPGASTGTWQSKRDALEGAGVRVVNSQPALIEAVTEALGGRRYFAPERYYERMRGTWDAPPPKATWSTSITRVAANDLRVRGVALADLIGTRSFLEVAALLIDGVDLDAARAAALDAVVLRAAAEPLPSVPLRAGDDLSKQLAAVLLADPVVASFEGPPLDRAACCLGRVGAALARILGNDVAGARGLSELACRALAGDRAREPRVAGAVEAMVVASVDHGVTPPSAQATILASTVRAAFEVAVASGVSAITDVHGGAGAKAAAFFRECAAVARDRDLSLEEAAERVIALRMAGGDRIEGLGHRVHTRDPRRDALWALAERAGVAGACVACSKVAEDAFGTVRGMRLPVNVDGVIGAIVADMDLDASVAKAIFVYGRVAGLAAHHFEEVATQPPMRRVDFTRAVYVQG